MNPGNRPVIPSTAGGIAAVALAVTGAPGPVTALAFGCFALSLIVIALQSVLPQEPKYLLAWWRARWRHQQLRREASRWQSDMPGSAGPREEPQTSETSENRDAISAQR
ncbi:hypothetical protein [Kitasatospora sp. NBC_01300]|uniref:hypothetical protein n=1 Tax=Kitasatospora sp. NBC_01300 TaxID=2903574 RepID=UPI00352C5A6E|nr:hypothetical protein OG556_00025 [Kitasatospora sp. NBC_01300]WSK08422.1 hypothetical protein OG556_33690 [Kitasatospora sp. NBC_01300]